MKSACHCPADGSSGRLWPAPGTDVASPLRFELVLLGADEGPGRRGPPLGAAGEEAGAAFRRWVCSAFALSRGGHRCAPCPACRRGTRGEVSSGAGGPGRPWKHRVCRPPPTSPQGPCCHRQQVAAPRARGQGPARPPSVLLGGCDACSGGRRKGRAIIHVKASACIGFRGWREECWS